MKSLLFIGLSLSTLMMGCGENPFGAGNFSLKNFATFAKKMDKPKSIHEDEADKATAQAALNSAQVATTAMARMGSVAESPAATGVVDEGIEVLNDSQFVYYQELMQKPSKEDEDKLETGRAEITFSYEGSPIDSQFNPEYIIEISNWSFEGYHEKTWITGHKDSVEISIDFSSGSQFDNLTPGLTSFRAWNVSSNKDAGQGDTAYFALDSLDDTLKQQYGSGSFFDSFTGEDNDGASRTFDFDLTILHKNASDSSKPYLNYHDNEGIMEFEFVYEEGEEPLTLWFSIHFYPQYHREGEIYRVEGDDKILAARFTHNEKTGEGETIWFDDEGNEVDRDTN